MKSEFRRPGTEMATAPLSPGSPIPSFDPNLVGRYGWIHNTTPQANEGSLGIPSLVTGTTVFNTGFVQGFSTGTQLAVTFNNTRQSLNAPNADYNPFSAGSLGLTVTQPLLQGFGIATNKRFIRIALNNEKIADLAFRQQLVATVSAVMRLYYDLVSVNQDVEVKQQTLQSAETLLENNQVQVAVGTLAPIEVARAQAEVARSRQALTNSESLVLQQEVILKNFLSRRGTEDPGIRSARIVATDRIHIPDKEAPQELEELVQQALKNRPDYLQAVFQLDNARIALKGSKNALLPQLDLVGTVANNGLAGEINPLELPGSLPPDQAFLGGYGTLLSQIFRRNYPDYGVFLQLNIPLRNREARAAMIRDAAQVNQSELRLAQLKHQVQTEVGAAIIALHRARAAYDAARQSRVLQEDALQAEQERYNVGATTSFFLIQYQRDLAQAHSDEVLAESLYAKAQTALERAIGMTLAHHNIEFDEAYNGQLRH